MTEECLDIVNENNEVISYLDGAMRGLREG